MIADLFSAFMDAWWWAVPLLIAVLLALTAIVLRRLDAVTVFRIFSIHMVLSGLAWIIGWPAPFTIVVVAIGWGIPAAVMWKRSVDLQRQRDESKAHPERGDDTELRWNLRRRQ